MGWLMGGFIAIVVTVISLGAVFESNHGYEYYQTIDDNVITVTDDDATPIPEPLTFGLFLLGIPFLLKKPK